MSLPFYRHVFLNGQLYRSWTMEDWIREQEATRTPEGAYLLLSESSAWYLRQWDNFVPLNDCDVPKELKALCLLLNISA